jgi:trypsin-like peptidase
MSFATTIRAIRESICAVMKVSPTTAPDSPSGSLAPPQYAVSFVGTAWCIVENKYFITANHIFNKGQPRNPEDKYVLFFVPNNGQMAYHTNVTRFVLENEAYDIALIEISSTPPKMTNIPAVPVTFAAQDDGNRVLTYGFPSPIISNAMVDVQGDWVRGSIFLKGHANEGIIAGQYALNGALAYELNVGWHHGESGGPIFKLDPAAAFALMQTYRGIQSPSGVYPGPRRGFSVEVIKSTLESIGATII